jgi:hypothetical protein
VALSGFGSACDGAEVLYDWEFPGSTCLSLSLEAFMFLLLPLLLPDLVGDLKTMDCL